MPITDAMRKRHTVRSYLDKPLAPETVSALIQRIDTINAKHNLAIKLVSNDTRAFNTLLKLVFAKGVKNYLVLAGDTGAQDTTSLELRLGYASSELMLFAQELGLNSWWVGGTYSRSAVAKLMPGQTVIGIVALGYGTNPGKPHKSKTPEQVSHYTGVAPAWFLEGVEAALLAPTALNRQAFSIRGAGNEVSISYQPGPFWETDLGIVRHHFELGAGTENFCWSPEQDAGQPTEKLPQ